MNQTELFPPDVPARRRREHGAPVDGIASGLGRRGPGAVRRFERGAGAPGGPVLGQRFPQSRMVGARQRARHGARPGARARWPTFASRMLFIRGLYNAEALKGNIHSSQTGNLLSGAPLASGGEIRSGTSFDQLLARTHGRSTKVPSLVLACEKSNPSVHKNYSMLYSSHISWTSPTTPTPLELYPALAFDRLFRDEAERGDKSVLDAVLSDAQRFPPRDQRERSAQARRVSRFGARGRAADRSSGRSRRAARLAAHPR